MTSISASKPITHRPHTREVNYKELVINRLAADLGDPHVANQHVDRYILELFSNFSKEINSNNHRIYSLLGTLMRRVAYVSRDPTDFNSKTLRECVTFLKRLNRERNPGEKKLPKAKILQIQKNLRKIEVKDVKAPVTPPAPSEVATNEPVSSSPPLIRKPHTSILNRIANVAQRSFDWLQDIKSSITSTPDPLVTQALKRVREYRQSQEAKDDVREHLYMAKLCKENLDLENALILEVLGTDTSGTPLIQIAFKDPKLAGLKYFVNYFPEKEKEPGCPEKGTVPAHLSPVSKTRTLFMSGFSPSEASKKLQTGEIISLIPEFAREHIQKEIDREIVGGGTPFIFEDHTHALESKTLTAKEDIFKQIKSFTGEGSTAYFLLCSLMSHLTLFETTQALSINNGTHYLAPTVVIPSGEGRSVPTPPFYFKAIKNKNIITTITDLPLTIGDMKTCIKCFTRYLVSVQYTMDITDPNNPKLSSSFRIKQPTFAERFALKRKERLITDPVQNTLPTSASTSQKIDLSNRINSLFKKFSNQIGSWFRRIKDSLLIRQASRQTEASNKTAGQFTNEFLSVAMLCAERTPSELVSDLDIDVLNPKSESAESIIRFRFKAPRQHLETFAAYNKTTSQLRLLATPPFPEDLARGFTPATPEFLNLVAPHIKQAARDDTKKKIDKDAYRNTLIFEEGNTETRAKETDDNHTRKQMALDMIEKFTKKDSVAQFLLYQLLYQDAWSHSTIATRIETPDRILACSTSPSLPPHFARIIKNGNTIEIILSFPMGISPNPPMSTAFTGYGTSVQFTVDVTDVNQPKLSLITKVKKFETLEMIDKKRQERLSSGA